MKPGRIRSLRGRGRLPEVLLVLGVCLAAGVGGWALARGGHHAEHATSTAGVTAPPASATTPPPPTAPTTAPPAVRIVTLTPFRATIAWRSSEPTADLVSYGPAALGPTRWLPPTNPGVRHTAELTGLSPATSFHVDVISPRPDGSRHLQTVDFSTPAAPVSAAASASTGWIRLDGEPWFPLLEYGMCSSLYDSSLETGITLFAENPCGGLDAQITALAGRAFSAAVVGEPATATSGVIGTFYPDEADDHGFTGALLPPIPTGLRFLTLSNHFYSGATALPSGRAVYPGLAAAADVVGFDLYPLQGWCAADRLVDVYHAQREAVALAAGKPTFQWIEAAGMNCPETAAVQITPDSVRAEAWLALAGGAHALGFFPAAWTADVARAITTVKTEIAAFLPALVAAQLPAATTDGAILHTTLTLDGAAYTIAVNTSSTPVDARLTIAGSAGRTVTVLGEQRTLQGSAGDQLADRFGPLAVHLYLRPPDGR